jgi:hypothetical protein
MGSLTIVCFTAEPTCQEPGTASPALAPGANAGQSDFARGEARGTARYHRQECARKRKD